MRVIDFSDGFETAGAPASVGAWTAPDGSTSAPGISWNSDPNSGFYRIGSDNFAAVCGGNAVTYWDTLGMRVGTNGGLIGREKFTVQMDVATGDASANNYGAWIRYKNATNTAFSQDAIALACDWRRTITADTTDTSAYPNAFNAFQIFNVSSGKTYTHAGTVANVRLSYPQNSGAGALAIAYYASLFIETSSLNTGTRKAGVYVGAQTGATYNAMITDSGAYTADYAIYLSSTKANFFGGPIGIDGGTSNDTMLRVKGSAVLAASSQYGIYCDTKFSQNATALGASVNAQPVLDAQSFTCALLVGFAVATPTIGSGATATRIAGFYSGPLSGGTNNAWAADNSSYSGNWAINFTSTNPSLFTGPMCFGSQDVASAASITDMACAASITRLTGSTATSLHGITAGKPGQLMIFRNLTGQNLTIKDQSGTESTAGARIITGTGADVTSTADSCHLFFYDGTTSRWILVAGQA